MDKHVCPYCGKEFDKCVQLGGHIVWCKQNPNKTYNDIKNKISEASNERNQKKEYNLNCCICGKEYKLLLTKHKFDIGKYRKTCSDECAKILSKMNTDIDNKNKKISKALKDKHINTPGRNIKKQKICPECGNIFTGNTKYCSDVCADIGRRKNISLSLKGKGGGLRPNAYKKYKSGWYHGIHCDSSWELAFIIYCEDHSIHPKRNTLFLEYTYKNQKYKYYPDFNINDKLYEIKGYENEKAKAKHEQHPEVEYIDKHKMKKYLDYVISTYGKDFIKLYDKMDKIPE